MNRKEPVTTQVCWVVAFQVEQQTYALPVEQVVRIIDMVRLTPLPGVEPAVVGAINVQGRIVPVVDLRRHFQRPPLPWKRHTPILLTTYGTQLIGLIVDTVTGVLDLHVDQMLRAADVLPADWPDVPLIQGIARTNQGSLWLLLDLVQLFRPDQVQTMLEAGAWLAQPQPDSPVSTIGVSS
jgi:purine-binding chemotaxis protein CheW